MKTMAPNVSICGRREFLSFFRARNRYWGHRLQCKPFVHFGKIYLSTYNIWQGCKESQPWSQKSLSKMIIVSSNDSRPYTKSERLSVKNHNNKFLITLVFVQLLVPFPCLSIVSASWLKMVILQSFNVFNCLFHFHVSAWSEPRGWQWSSCKHLPPLSSDLRSTLSSNSLSFAWSMIHEI